MKKVRRPKSLQWRVAYTYARWKRLGGPALEMTKRKFPSIPPSTIIHYYKTFEGLFERPSRDANRLYR